MQFLTAFVTKVTLLMLCIPTSTLGKYVLVDDYTSSPATFFSSFNTYDGPDLTNGFTEYVDLTTAASSNLIGFVNPDNTTAFAADLYNQRVTGIQLRVDTTTNLSSSLPAATGRRSVYLTSKKNYTAGTLLVMDINHIPTGCGAWGALWMLGTTATWPNAGEIDIIEGVNMGSQNAMTLHTSQGCIVENSTDVVSTTTTSANSTAVDFTGTMLTDNCWIDAPGQGTNQGCSIQAPEATNNSAISPVVTASGTIGSAAENLASGATFGAPFNAQGGGIYAMEWASDHTGFSIWFFPRSSSSTPSSLQQLSSLPSTPSTDPTSITPDTTTFGTPIARFSSASAEGGCDFEEHFTEMQIVINIALCGAWAGEADVWAGSSGEGDCKVSTGYDTCEAFVRSEAGALDEAFWELGGLWVFGEE